MLSPKEMEERLKNAREYTPTPEDLELAKELEFLDFEDIGGEEDLIEMDATGIPVATDEDLFPEDKGDAADADDDDDDDEDTGDADDDEEANETEDTLS